MQLSLVETKYASVHCTGKAPILYRTWSNFYQFSLPTYYHVKITTTTILISVFTRYRCNIPFPSFIGQRYTCNFHLIQPHQRKIIIIHKRVTTKVSTINMSCNYKIWGSFESFERKLLNKLNPKSNPSKKETIN